MARDGGFGECCVLYDKTPTDASTIGNVDSLQKSMSVAQCIPPLIPPLNFSLVQQMHCRCCVGIF